MHVCICTYVYMIYLLAARAKYMKKNTGTSMKSCRVPNDRVPHCVFVPHPCSGSVARWATGRCVVCVTVTNPEPSRTHWLLFGALLLLSVFYSFCAIEKGTCFVRTYIMKYIRTTAVKVPDTLDMLRAGRAQHNSMYISLIQQHPSLSLVSLFSLI